MRNLRHIPILAVALAVLLLVVLVIAAPSRAIQGPTFTVNSAGDAPDLLPGDGVCDTLVPAPGTCTLRAAIQESNAQSGSANIVFASTITLISPSTTLPMITDTVELNGALPVGGRVEIDGSSLSGPAPGLLVLAQGSFVESLEIKGFPGVGVQLSAPATVGGNVILQNGGAGLVMGQGGGAFGNSIALNQGPGIRVDAGPVTLNDNSVEQNTGDGIDVVAGSGINIARGSFIDNGGLGIDLNADGVTANDAGDIDTGPNGLQNFPELTGATTTGTRPQPGEQTVVQGTMDAAGPVTVRLYESGSCDPSGHGEGSIFLGEGAVGGSGPFTITLPSVGENAGDVVTATATDSNGNTSEFSNCVVPVLVGADLGVTKSASPGAGPGEFVTAGNQIQYLVTVSNAGPDPATHVTLTDVLPPPNVASFVSATPSQGTCGTPDSNGAMPCQLGSIAVGGSATIDIRVNVTITSSTNLINHVLGLDADQTDPVCTLEPGEPGQTDTPQCDSAEAVTHVEPPNGDAGGFVSPGGMLSTGTTATASDPTVVSLTNNGTTGTEATLAELGCPGSGDPLCSDPNIVGQTVSDVSIAGTAAALTAPTAPTQPAPFTVSLLYDKTIVPAAKLSALHVYAGTTQLAACSRKVTAPCVASMKILSGSKDLEVKVALRASAKLRTTTS